MVSHRTKRAITSAANLTDPIGRYSDPAHTRRLSLLLLAAVILSTQFLPSLPVFLGLASSRAAGMIAAAAIAILIMGVAWARAPKPQNITVLDLPANGLILVFAFLVAIVFHSTVANHIEPLDASRFGASLIPLIFLLVGASAIGSAIRCASIQQIDTVLWASFILFLGVILLRILNFEPNAPAFSHPTFPFSETSHFALAFGPVYLYRCAKAGTASRYLWILFGFACALVLRSATLMAFAVGGALISRKTLITITILLISLLAGVAARLTYFTSRADISSHSSSISALVYLQGWEFIKRSWQISDGWGIGFQQLGVHPESVPASELIRTMNNGKNLNTKDGSFLFSKLASEMGLFGVIATCAFLVICLKLICRIRDYTLRPHDLFASCVVIGFGVDMFIRGIGYFYGEPLLFLGALLSLSPARHILRATTPSAQNRLLALR